MSKPTVSVASMSPVGLEATHGENALRSLLMTFSARGRNVATAAQCGQPHTVLVGHVAR